MIAAKIYPEPDAKRGSGGNKSFLSLARMVLREAPDLGSAPLLQPVAPLLQTRV